MLWEAVPRQIDVNNPVFFSGACVGIFHWSFLSDKFFPQTDMIFPTNRQDFSIKPTWFFPQTDMIFLTNWHDFATNRHEKNVLISFLILCPYTHQATPALTSRPLQHMTLIWELKQYNFKVLWRTEYYKETFYSFLWKLGTDLAPKMAEADRNRPFW